MIYVAGTGAVASTAASQATMEALLGLTSTDGYTSIWCEYPGSLPPIVAGPSFGASIAQGVTNLHALIASTFAAHPTANVCVVGFSQGSMVIDQVLTDFENGIGTPPPVDQFSYLAIIDPIRPGGMFSHLWEVGTVMFPGWFDYTVIAIPNTRYSGNVIFWQYDSISDYPDGIGSGLLAMITSEWPLSVINGVAGSVFMHFGVASMLGWDTPSQITQVLMNTSTYSGGGTCKTWMQTTYPMPLEFPLALWSFGPDCYPLFTMILRAWIEPAYNRYGRNFNPYP